VQVGIDGPVPEVLAAALATVDKSGQTRPTRFYLTAAITAIAALLAVIAFATGRPNLGVIMILVVGAAAAVAVRAALALRQGRRNAAETRKVIQHRVAEGQRKIRAARQAHRETVREANQEAADVGDVLAAVEAESAKMAG
jgi:hypothetical protein